MTSDLTSYMLLSPAHPLLSDLLSLLSLLILLLTLLSLWDLLLLSIHDSNTKFSQKEKHQAQKSQHVYFKYCSINLSIKEKINNSFFGDSSICLPRLQLAEVQVIPDILPRRRSFANCEWRIVLASGPPTADTPSFSRWWGHRNMFIVYNFGLF